MSIPVRIRLCLYIFSLRGDFFSLSYYTWDKKLYLCIIFPYLENSGCLLMLVLFYHSFCLLLQTYTKYTYTMSPVSRSFFFSKYMVNGITFMIWVSNTFIHNSPSLTVADVARITAYMLVECQIGWWDGR